MHAFEDEDNYNKNTVKLASSLNLRDICSEAGAVFDIEESETKPEEKLLYDENLVSKLSMGLGIGNGEDSDSDEDDETSALEPFARLLLDMEDISEDGGVYKKVLKTGVGGGIPPNAVINYHYDAYLEYCDEPFDSTLFRKKTEKYRLGSKRVIPGLEIALQSMIKKEKSRFIIASSYAYGEVGCEPRIPRNASILYEITILDFCDNFDAEMLENIDSETPIKESFKKCMAYARAKHREGNSEMKNGNLRKARKCYRSAAWKLGEIASSNNDVEENEREKELVILFNNIAKVCLDIKEPKQACEYCRRALDIQCNDPVTRSKTYFRYGKAKEMLNEFDKAKMFLLKAQNFNQNSIEISNELETLCRKMVKCLEDEKILYSRMFQTLGCKQVHNKKKLKLITVAEENRELIERQIREFILNKNERELYLPPNMTKDEINFAESIATNCAFKKLRNGPNTIIKLEK